MYLFWISIVVLILLLILLLWQRNIKQKKKVAKSPLLQKKQVEQKRKADRKGELGEYKINFDFERLPKEYKYLANIMIRSSKGLTQIDHIVLSPYGIFVVETKNYAGWIFGNEKDKYWTQTFYNKKNRFYNPIRQNYGHVQAIKEILKDYKNIKFYPIIAFSRRCELREIKSSVPVLFDTDISNFIIRKNKEIFLNELDIANIYQILKEANITDKHIREEHIQKIKTITQGEKDITLRKSVK